MEKQDNMEKQCALVKDMGLTYREYIQQVMGMMLDMEKRDNNVAAEKGINIINHDNPLL